MVQTKEWLKMKRNEYNLTRNDMSRGSGISVDTVIYIESGRRKGSDLSWFKMISYLAALGDEESNSLCKGMGELKRDQLKYKNKDIACIVYYEVKNKELVVIDYHIGDFSVIPLKTNQNYLIAPLCHIDTLLLNFIQNKKRHATS